MKKKMKILESSGKEVKDVKELFDLMTDEDLMFLLLYNRGIVDYLCIILSLELALKNPKEIY